MPPQSSASLLLISQHQEQCAGVDTTIATEMSERGCWRIFRWMSGSTGNERCFGPRLHVTTQRGTPTRHLASTVTSACEMGVGFVGLGGKCSASRSRFVRGRLRQDETVMMGGWLVISLHDMVCFTDGPSQSSYHHNHFTAWIFD